MQYFTGSWLLHWLARPRPEAREAEMALVTAVSPGGQAGQSQAMEVDTPKVLFASSCPWTSSQPQACLCTSGLLGGPFKMSAGAVSADQLRKHLIKAFCHLICACRLSVPSSVLLVGRRFTKSSRLWTQPPPSFVATACLSSTIAMVICRRSGPTCRKSGRDHLPVSSRAHLEAATILQSQPVPPLPALRACVLQSVRL